jgi:hypothetical protein
MVMLHRTLSLRMPAHGFKGLSTSRVEHCKRRSNHRGGRVDESFGDFAKRTGSDLPGHERSSGVREGQACPLFGAVDWEFVRQFQNG